MRLLRSLLFFLAFYLHALIVVPWVAVMALFGQDSLFRACAAWSSSLIWLTRVIAGIGYRVEGKLPDGPCLYAIKHEAAFEAILTLSLFHRPAVVMKAELAKIPVWGGLVRRHGSIFVDRSGQAGMLRAMARQAATAVKAGRPVVIFPEGTRVPRGQQPALAAGFAGLYRLLDLPVVPVALDSGRFWHKGLMKDRGTITLKVGETIPPGLPRAEVEARTLAAINALNEAPSQS